MNPKVGDGEHDKDYQCYVKTCRDVWGIDPAPYASWLQTSGKISGAYINFMPGKRGL